ncbi:MAG: ferredoxin [Planctomycetota bacterium]|nr:ferredoxin [Planctomycetota bacterium]
MAIVADKYDDNVDGAFYVDKQCILCHLCSDIAPDHFKESEDGDHDTVWHQPESDEDIALCLEALEQCPVEAIGTDG